MYIFLFVCSLLVPLSMILLGYKWKDKPPKDKNGVSGYRTTMSRLNDTTWKYAHKYWGKINLVLGIILIILTISIFILSRKYADFEKLITYLVFVQLGVMTLTIIPTEILLNRRFTKQGTKK
ncbi:MAG: SdpI family protein [Hespellia sp.]|nr:SdpI family protein [Hespellia sp.]